MTFNGITREFDLANEQQYETIGRFWDEMALRFGLENLRGLGYAWCGNTISYAIGLKTGDIPDSNFRIMLPDGDWQTVKGYTVRLKDIYDEIYLAGTLQYEIETFYEDGTCEICYYR